jgi:hypothetical protein
MFDRVRQWARLPQAAELLLKISEAANDDGLIEGTATSTTDESGQLRAGARNRLFRTRRRRELDTCELLLRHRTSPGVCGA